MDHKKPFGNKPGSDIPKIPGDEGLNIPDNNGLNIPWNQITGNNEGFPIPGGGTFYIPGSGNTFGDNTVYSSLDDLDNIPDPPGHDDQTPIPDA
jgi:hypothetical protein